MSPMLDVASALTNPYTLSTFDVLRRKQIVDTYGESKQSVETSYGVQGVVYPEGANELSRRPEAETNNKTIVVITRFSLRGESDSSEDDSAYLPDIVRWKGSHFVVAKVEDYSQYANGFVKATATSMTIVDQPPQTRS